MSWRTAATNEDGLSGQFVRMFYFFVCSTVAVCELVHDVEAIHDLSKLITASENLF